MDKIDIISLLYYWLQENFSSFNWEIDTQGEEKFINLNESSLIACGAGAFIIMADSPLSSRNPPIVIDVRHPSWLEDLHNWLDDRLNNA